ncbi:glycosyltransferase family 1 protein [Acidiphilium sp. PA]|uniref:glycosyltransferase family 4 protein n=1 Tax=Acidiphilium sp. PA TaxID=2871705 RepID=UPI002244D18D|nr:glycosyltransferase family 1 protein [Acidiphilium sp. PA]MCW8306647.1 glycosyltransferase family 1 protein [Acidiphilium sp. PA]
MQRLPEPSRILIVTDAWHSQVNGVVRTLSMLTTQLERLGQRVLVVGPDRFHTLPCPSYPEVRLSLFPRRRMARLFDEFQPDALHIATEGPLGIAASRLARRLGWQFTTAYHTRFPDYLAARTALPHRIAYAWLRRFHDRGSGTMVATRSLAAELRGHGFANTLLWSRGVDAALFNPDRATALPYPGPIFLSVGRLAVEKNLTAFLDLDLPGTKLIVGDGPERKRLEQRYAGERTLFLGTRQGRELATLFASADVFVFPSRTDTFGLVVLESLAAGTPVAAFPVCGPRDIFGGAFPRVGILDDDLRAAAMAALKIDRQDCRRFAEQFSWEACATLFIKNLVPIGPN